MIRTCPMCGNKEEVKSEDDSFICPSCGTEIPSGGEKEAAVEIALRKVRPPALGLIIVGVLMVLFGTVGVMGFFVVPPRIEGVVRIWTAVDTFQLAVMALSPIQGLVLVFGGRAMRRLKSRRWAVAGSITSMVPGGFIAFGLPFGIWSLIVLTRPSVKAAFAKH